MFRNTSAAGRRGRPSRGRGGICALAAVTALVGLLTPRPAAAQPRTVESCARIEDEAARLACFDALAESAEGSRASEPNEAASETPRTAPGRHARMPRAAARPSPADAGPQDSARFGLEPEPLTTPEALDVVITEVGTTVDGTAVFATEEGQIWLQISTRTRAYPDVPFDARIEAGSVGSYFLSLPGGGPDVRVSRRR